MTTSDTTIPARRVGRRDLMKLTGVGAAALAAGSLFNNSNAEPLSVSSPWRGRPGDGLTLPA